MFFDRLQAACDLKGVSMSALLDKVNMSRGNIARWKSGLEPKAATKIKLADALGIDRDALEERGKEDDLYNKIESLCIERGVNITNMCKEAGVPRSALSDYKAGRIKSLSADKLSKIASYFGVSVDYLLGNDKKNKLPAQKSGELSKKQEEYIEKIKNLTEEQQKLLDVFLTGLENQ